MLKRSIRYLLVVLVCGLLVFSQVLPANAKQNVKSSPYEGEANLNAIQAETDETVYDPPMSLKEIQQRTGKGGLNELQGTADADKMKNPENSQGSSIIEEVKGALEDLTGK
jgi:hypothetical protein